MIRLALLSLLWLSSIASAAPLGSSFTYQGQLQQNAVLAAGSYDFEFRLFDNLSIGNQVGSTLTTEDIAVTDGIFSVELDFGVSPFTGNELWLEIGVREAGNAGGFQLLAPRQRITSAPFALLAQQVTAGSVGVSEIVPTEVQRRAAGNCAAGTYLIGINQDGSLNCAAFADQLPEVEARLAALEGTGDVPACLQGGSIEIDSDVYQITKDGLSILGVDPNLTANGFQPFRVRTCDWTVGDTLLNIFQTGVTNPPVNGWDEEHIIPSVLASDGDATTPRTDLLELVIQHVNTIGEVGNDTTLFNSDDQGALTYALRIYDGDASLSDCIVWGHNPAAVFSGQVSTNRPHTNIGEISPANCDAL